MSAITLINELNDLINTHGIERVKHGLAFLEHMPVAPEPKTVTFNVLHRLHSSPDYTGTYTLTADQYATIKTEVNAYRKIQAIKLFREYTHIGLKEAKDAVESEFYKY